jgi:hypothetical protein
MRTAAAALLYFLAVYTAGFLFGTVRVLLVEPRLGPFAAVLCEAPFLLLVIIAAARWAPRAAGMPRTGGTLVLAGFGALIMQQIADVIVGATLRGLSMPEQFARFATAEGAVYAAMLILFAFMPALVSKAERSTLAPSNRSSIV